MKWTTLIVAFVILGVPAVGRATPIGPVYPAPGNNALSTSGSIDQAGGSTLVFTGFDTSAWSDLFWAAISGNLGNANYNTLGSTGILSQTISGNTIDYRLSTPWQFLDTQTNTTVSGTVDLIQKFTDMSNNPITALVNPGPGLPDVLPITASTLSAWGGGYKVNQIFSVNGTDAASFFAANHGGPNTFQANATAGFFYDPAAVPEPISLVLLGTGLGLTGLYRRRARQ